MHSCPYCQATSWDRWRDHLLPFKNQHHGEVAITPDFARSLSKEEYSELKNILYRTSFQKLFESGLKKEINHSLGNKAAECIDRFCKMLKMHVLIDNAIKKGANHFARLGKESEYNRRGTKTVRNIYRVSPEWHEIQKIHDNSSFYLSKVFNFDLEIEAEVRKLNNELYDKKKGTRKKRVKKA